MIPASDSKRTTLAQACSPFFLFLTTFRRNAATSSLGIEGLQAALQRELERVKNACERDRRLHPLFERIWYGLVTTADQTVLTSTWPHKAGWSMKLLESHYFRTAEGGRRFFELVQEILDDPTEAGPELAEVLFICMGLGFQGELGGERRELERRRMQLFDKARLGQQLDEHLSPDAYGRNATKNLNKLPTVNTLKLVLVALGSLLFVKFLPTLTLHSDEALGADVQRAEQLIRRLENEPLPAENGTPATDADTSAGDDR